MQETINPIQGQVLGPAQRSAGVTLKSIFNDPKYLKSLLIFSVVISIMLLCAVVSLSSRGTTPTPTPTPTVSRTPTVTPTVTETPQQELTRLQKCFKECGPQEFLTTLKEEIAKVKFFKETRDYVNLADATCLGTYSEHQAPDRQFNSYFFPQVCGNNLKYTNQTTDYVIANKKYSLNNIAAGIKWDTATVQPITQTRILDIVDRSIKQQDIKSEFEQRGDEQVRVLTAESQIVNDFNQLVKVKIQIKISQDYRLVYFYNFQENAFEENARFYDYNIPNKIEAPAIN